MTSVPKPLKFLRGHYGTLKETLDTVAAGDNRRAVRAALIVQHRRYQCSTITRCTVAADLGSECGPSHFLPVLLSRYPPYSCLALGSMQAFHETYQR